MKLHLTAPDRTLIQVHSCGAEGCQVAGEKYHGNLLLLPDQVIGLELSDLSFAEIGALIKQVNEKGTIIDSLLFGTGDKLVFPEEEQYQGFLTLGYGVDFMDNSAACRTFNVLVAEYRQVACILSAVA